MHDHKTSRSDPGPSVDGRSPCGPHADRRTWPGVHLGVAQRPEASAARPPLTRQPTLEEPCDPASSCPVRPCPGPARRRHARQPRLSRPGGRPADHIKINEVESNGGTPVDWIELRNNGATTTDVSGLRLKDNDDSRTFAIPAGTTIPAGGYLAVDVDVAGGFGLGGADAARVFIAGRHDADRLLQLDRARDGDLRPLSRRHGRLRPDRLDKGRGQRLPAGGHPGHPLQRGGVQRRPGRRLGRADEHQPRPGRRGRAEVQGRRRHPRLLLNPRGHHDRAGRLLRPERGGVRLRARERRVRRGCSPATRRRSLDQLLLDRARGHDLRPLP